MKRALFEIYDVLVTAVVMVFTSWGSGYFDRVRSNIARFEKFVERIFR